MTAKTGLLLDIGADLERFAEGNSILDVENIRDLMAWSIELQDSLSGLIDCAERRVWPSDKRMSKARAALDRYKNYSDG